MFKNCSLLKVAFYQKVRFVFQISKKKYFRKKLEKEFALHASFQMPLQEKYVKIGEK